MKKKLAELEIKSSIKYKIMMFGGAIMHATFFIIFLICGIKLMAWFNIFSVLFYMLGGILCDLPSFEKNIFAWLVALYTEVTFHGMLATFIVGTDAGFYLYIMMALPVAMYLMFFACSRKRFWHAVFFETSLTFVSLMITLAVIAKNGTLMETMYHRSLSYAEISFMHSINIFYNTIMLAVFSLLFIIEIINLVDRLNKTNQQLEYTATHDALTGMYNRHSLKPFFSELESGNERFCVLLGDIDDFKKVNDTYGHDAGDLVLKTVADIIKSEMMNGDLDCRWGGEEMLIIMRGGKHDCMSRANMLRQQIIAKEMTHEDKTLKVTMTFGFSESTEITASPAEGISRVEALISLADKRLYRGKTSGKNKIVS